jgi:CubicO group peptidase (beta-lactamase class C family)
MIVRITLLLGVFFMSCACGTGQDPNYNSASLHAAQFSYQNLAAGEKEKLAAAVRVKYEKLLGKNFSGQIIVAKNGAIVFEEYKGYANYSSKTDISSETPIHLASISKTFTGMAVLKLWEQHKIDIAAPVTKYLPKFPYENVSIEQLLSHRSGLPDYTYFMETRKYTNVKTKTKKGRWINKLKLIAKATKINVNLFKGFMFI